MAKVLISAAMLGLAIVLFVIALIGNRPDGPPPPSAPVASAATVDALLEAARVAVRTEEPGRGVAILSAGVAEHPADVELRLALAELLVRTGDHAAAADQFAEAIALGTIDGATLYAAGSVARLTGQNDRAADWLGRAVRAEPANPGYAVHFAQTLLARGDVEGAKAELVRAVALDESLAIAWGTLGEIHLRENNAELARDMARRARVLEPAVTAWRVIEARALNRLGEPRLALEVLAAVGPEAEGVGAVERLREQSRGLLGGP